jgi:hypothetical protein
MNGNFIILSLFLFFSIYILYKYRYVTNIYKYQYILHNALDTSYILNMYIRVFKILTHQNIHI